LRVHSRQQRKKQRINTENTENRAQRAQTKDKLKAKKRAAETPLDKQALKNKSPDQESGRFAAEGGPYNGEREKSRRDAPAG
jgi:hypothetical protein